jgi:TonB family protein
VKALYTDGAQAAKIEGDVIMRAVILPDGTVRDVTVTKSLDRVYGLDQQAVEAVRQWVFKPATKDGKPVAVRMAITTRFTLQ